MAMVLSYRRYCAPYDRQKMNSHIVSFKLFSTNHNVQTNVDAAQKGK